MAALPATVEHVTMKARHLYSTAIMPPAGALRLPGFSLSVLRRRALA